MSKLVTIKTYTDRYGAELAKNLLAAHDIPAIILADDLGGWRPDLLASTGGARLLIKESDQQKALRILRDS